MRLLGAIGQGIGLALIAYILIEAIVMNWRRKREED